MYATRIPLTETKQFSKLFLDYVAEKATLKPFYGLFPKLENFAAQIQTKQNFPATHRSVLVNALKEQYEGLEEVQIAQIESLNDSRTFTICTGHQLNLFSGPLFFHYKIQTVIKASALLKAQYPDYHFVPIYWMATEDHDFEEINHFHLFGKKYIWEQAQRGAVGNYSTAGITPILEDLGEKASIFAKAYQTQKTLTDATRAYTHALYGAQGLLVLDASHQALKRLAVPHIKAELLHNFSERALSDSSQRLAEDGYDSQMAGRNINLFYMVEGLRERIVKDSDATYRVLNTDMFFSEEALLNLLDTQPELFSPNVVLRPLYQECILPNLAYCGGPGEIAYWLQLKGVFEASNIPFPILLPRQFVLYINNNQHEKLKKLKVAPTQIFEELSTLKNNLLNRLSTHTFDLEQEKKEFDRIFMAAKGKIGAVESSLIANWEAEKTKFLKTIENIEKRLKKAEELKHETSIKQLEQVYQKLFPDGSMQERFDNLLSISLNKPNYLAEIYELINPFDNRLLLVCD